MGTRYVVRARVKDIFGRHAPLFTVVVPLPVLLLMPVLVSMLMPVLLLSPLLSVPMPPPTDSVPVPDPGECPVAVPELTSLLPSPGLLGITGGDSFGRSGCDSFDSYPEPSSNPSSSSVMRLPWSVPSPDPLPEPFQSVSSEISNYRL